MLQYCRYCNALVVGDVPYCQTREQVIKEKTAKSRNRCAEYEYNPIDAFRSNRKGYRERVKKEPEPEDLPGQMNIWDILREGA